MGCIPSGSLVHGILQARMGCHFLLQGIFPTQGSNIPLLKEANAFPQLCGVACHVIQSQQRWNQIQATRLTNPFCNSFRCFPYNVIKRTFIEQIFIEHPVCAWWVSSLSGRTNDIWLTGSDHFSFLWADTWCTLGRYIKCWFSKKNSSAFFYNTLQNNPNEVFGQSSSFIYFKFLFTTGFNTQKMQISDCFNIIYSMTRNREGLVLFISEVKWSKMNLLSRVRFFVTPWTVAYQDPQSMGFSRQEYWSGLPFPSPSTVY